MSVEIFRNKPTPPNVSVFLVLKGGMENVLDLFTGYGNHPAGNT
jgi:hypothetical protein